MLKDIFDESGLEIKSKVEIDTVTVNMDSFIEKFIESMMNIGVMFENKNLVYIVYRLYVKAMIDVNFSEENCKAPYCIPVNCVTEKCIDDTFYKYDKEKVDDILHILRSVGVSIAEGYEEAVFNNFADMTKGMISFMKSSIIKSKLNIILVRATYITPSNTVGTMEFILNKDKLLTISSFGVQPTAESSTPSNEGNIKEEKETTNNIKDDEEDEWGTYGVDF